MTQSTPRTCQSDCPSGTLSAAWSQAWPEPSATGSTTHWWLLPGLVWCPSLLVSFCAFVCMYVCVLTSMARSIRYWFHYTLVVFAWLGVVPLTACEFLCMCVCVYSVCVCVLCVWVWVWLGRWVGVFGVECLCVCLYKHGQVLVPLHTAGYCLA